jgi:hypothetical protein
MFVRDADDQIYLAHTGKVGGGRRGIGLRAFRNFLGDNPWQEIDTLGGRRTAVVLGPIDAPGFPNQIDGVFPAVPVQLTFRFL